MSFKTFKKLKALLMKSAVVQLEIEQETRQKHPDWRRLLTLKKQRLIIKDSIRRLRKLPPRASLMH